MDFGPGLYTTRDPVQAANWAAKYGKNAEVLHFQVPQSRLDALNSVTFEGPSGDLADYVRYYAGGGLGQPYSMAEGPMLMSSRAKFARGGMPTWGGNQVVFFGDTGPMLDAGLQ